MTEQLTCTHIQVLKRENQAWHLLLQPISLCPVRSLLRGWGTHLGFSLFASKVLVQSVNWTICQLDYYNCPQLIFAPPPLSFLFMLQLDWSFQTRSAHVSLPTQSSGFSASTHTTVPCALCFTNRGTADTLNHIILCGKGLSYAS